MSKHTPGPWIVDAHTVGRYKGVNVETEMGDRIASAGHSTFNLDEKQANARLIAAAPDLLKVLKAIGEFAKTGQPLHWGALITDSDEETALETVLNVIAKAEGK